MFNFGRNVCMVIIKFMYSLHSMSDLGSETTYEAQVEEAKTLMQQRLPDYVVNCLVSSGLDTLPLTADMDVNSLDDVDAKSCFYYGQW